MTDTPVSVCLALGSNIGDRQRNLDRAEQLIARRVGPLTARSHRIETEPWGYSSTHGYLNSAITVATRLEPEALLDTTEQIERELGRRQKGVYADRTIDIDILLYGRSRVSTPRLTIPHPRIMERDFVLTPLRELLPERLIDELCKIPTT